MANEYMGVIKLNSPIKVKTKAHLAIISISEMYVRPVFTVPFDTQVEQSKDIIEGQTVYILTAEKPSEGKG